MTIQATEPPGPPYVPVTRAATLTGYSHTLIRRLAADNLIRAIHVEAPPGRPGSGRLPSMYVHLDDVQDHLKRSSHTPRRNRSTRTVPVDSVRELLLGGGSLHERVAWVRTHLAPVFTPADLNTLLADILLADTARGTQVLPSRIVPKVSSDGA